MLRVRDLVGGAAVALGVGALCYFGVLAAIAVGLPIAQGGSSLVIAGKSMEPTVPRGSVVVNDPADIESTTAGEIISFSIDGRTITHRIVEITDEGIRTRGDGNGAADSTLITQDDLVGRARLVVPWVGWPSVWMNEGNMFALGLAMAIIIGDLYLIFRFGIDREPIIGI